MSDSQRKVFVVDDEPAVLDLSCRVIAAAGFDAHPFTSVRDFFVAVDQTVDCVVTDLRMPDAGGIDLLNELSRRGLEIPVVVLTGHADVPTAVGLMERGVVTLLEKPFVAAHLVHAVERAIQVSVRQRLRFDEAQTIRAHFDRLSDEEREVMREMINGASNKVIAMQLSISARTLDRRRRTVLETMGVDSVAELSALAERNRLFSR